MTYSNSGIELYSFWRSSCSWRVRIALNLKQIPYEIKPICLVKGGNRSEEYLRINPTGKIPALLIDGHTLIESLAIINYLDETRPQYPLMPKDPFKRAQVRGICDVIVSGIQPLQNTMVPNTFVGTKTEGGKFWIARGFEALEKLLVVSSGKYCVGDEITVADLCLVPQVYNARRYEVDMSPFPNIVRIDADLAKHPAFIVTHPSKQVDCPKE